MGPKGGKELNSDDHPSQAVDSMQRATSACATTGSRAARVDSVHNVASAMTKARIDPSEQTEAKEASKVSSEGKEPIRSKSAINSQQPVAAVVHQAPVDSHTAETPTIVQEVTKKVGKM